MLYVISFLGGIITTLVLLFVYAKIQINKRKENK